MPGATRRALDEHGALGMWVVQFETPPDGRCPCRRHRLAARVLTISHRSRPGGTASTRAGLLLATLRAAGASTRTIPHPQRPRCSAVYDWMARSDAPLTLAALEDLWLEPEPQNRPGTPAIDNFRRRAPFGIEDFDTLPDLPALLNRLDSGRRSTSR